MFYRLVAKPVCLRLLFAAVTVSFGTTTAADDPFEFFEKRIRPVLVQRCYECHSRASKQKGGLLLDSREGIRRGGDSGHAVIPRDVAGSMLVEAIRYESFEMPPDGRLPDSVVADFIRWIEMGAPDPRDKSGSGDARDKLLLKRRATCSGRCSRSSHRKCHRSVTDLGL